MKEFKTLTVAPLVGVAGCFANKDLQSGKKKVFFWLIQVYVFRNINLQLFYFENLHILYKIHEGEGEYRLIIVCFLITDLFIHKKLMSDITSNAVFLTLISLFNIKNSTGSFYKTKFYLLLHQEHLLILCVDLFVVNKLRSK